MPAHGGCRVPDTCRRHRCHRSPVHRGEMNVSPASSCASGERNVQAFSSQIASAKPRAMNRTGLFIALSITIVIGLLFGIYPELDLKLAALFYDPATRIFPLKLDAV